MDIDRYSYQSKLRKELEKIIDEDDVILQSLFFFSQDEDEVSGLPASSVIDLVKSVSWLPKEYEYLKLVFEQINQEIGSVSSKRCYDIIADLSVEHKHVHHTSKQQQTAPSLIYPNPEELSHEFLFENFPKFLGTNYLVYFAINGLRMPQIEYRNETLNKEYPYDTIAVLNWWKGTRDGNRYEDPPPSYTLSGLINALKRAGLYFIVELVKQNSPS